MYSWREDGGVEENGSLTAPEPATGADKDGLINWLYVSNIWKTRASKTTEIVAIYLKSPMS
jgi:hypothetical protein